MNRQLNINLLNVSSNLKATIEIPSCLGILENPTDVAQKGFGCIRVMTQEDGDKRIVWDNNDFAQISEAKNMFDNLVMQGLVPYCVGDNGRAADVMIEFDPYAEEIIFCPMHMAVGG